MFLKVTIRKNKICIFRSDQIPYGNTTHYKLTEKNVHCLLMANIDLDQKDKNSISDTIKRMVKQLFIFLDETSPMKFYDEACLSDGTHVDIKLSHKM